MSVPNTWAEQDFAVTLQTLQKRYPAEFLTQDSNEATAQSTVEDIMALAKEDLRKELKKFLDGAFPNTISSLKTRILSYRTGRFDNSTPISYRGVVNASGEFIDEDENFVNGIFFYCNDAPVNGTSGTYAGDADNGRYLIARIASFDYLYINRGTKASPDWQTTGELTDYISNPEELTESYILACKYFSFQHRRDGSVQNSMMDTGVYHELSKECKKEYDRELCRAKPNIRPDTGADGLISDFELTATKEMAWFS